MKPDTPHILFVNPWIHDFAAYDFWAKPLGLLTLAAILRDHKIAVSYIDCLDRFHPKAPATDPCARHGRGPYLKTRIEKPRVLEDVPRHYSRYGILPEWFREALLSIGKPDLVFVTSLMTYWYPGVQETIDVIKDVFPHTTVILGGVYATLCKEHAKAHSGADRIVTGPGESQILSIVSDATGISLSPRFDTGNLDTYPTPAFDLQRRISYVPLLTSQGCPFSCAYCASHILQPKRMLKDPGAVVEEIKYWYHAHGVRDFVFYDDALLLDAEQHAVPLFEKTIESGLKIRFHTPNAVHVRGLTKQTARLMFMAGFETLRLGLETTEFEGRSQLDKKVTAMEFSQAVSFLKAAGFKKRQIGAYLLVGLPEQSEETIVASIQTVIQNGITPVPAYYSPIPGTALWKKAVESSRYDINADPLFCNNAIFPCRKEGFSWKMISRLKEMTRGGFTH